MKSVVPWSPAPSLAVAACNDGARMQRAQPPLVLNRSRPQCVLSWDAFPLDLVHRVLAYLDGIDAIRCVQVCHSWKSLWSRAPLWKELSDTTTSNVMFPQCLNAQDNVLRMARLRVGFDLAKELPGDVSQTEIKIVATGGRGCGTSSLVDRFHTGVFPSERDIASDLAVRVFAFTPKLPTLREEGSRPPQSVKLVDLRDTVRPSPFPNTRLWTNSTGLLVMVDLSTRSSLQQARDIITAKRRRLPAIFDSMPIALVGCKADLPHEITRSDIASFVDSFQIPYFETSAAEAKSIESPFLYVLKRLFHIRV